MIRLEHVAIWTPDLERLKDFYVAELGATAGARYHNPVKRFSSYFVSWGEGARVELMTCPEADAPARGLRAGYAHLALSLGSEPAVDAAARRLADRLLDGPRRTGDGYYECVIADPDGNLVELTA